MSNSGFWNRQDHPDDIEFEFVKVEKLPGLRRWRLIWRTNPATPWSSGESRFVSGTGKTIYREAMQKNAELTGLYYERVRAEKEVEKQRRRAAKTRRDEEHRRGDQDGTHTSGHWWNCPVCNPNKHRWDRPKGE